MQRVIGDL